MSTASQLAPPFFQTRTEGRARSRFTTKAATLKRGSAEFVPGPSGVTLRADLACSRVIAHEVTRAE